MSIKGWSVVRRTPEEQRLRLQRLRAAEEILLGEFNTAQIHFDQVVQENQRGQVQEAVERYIAAMQRMRQFLAEGEIPLDVATKLPDAADDVSSGSTPGQGTPAPRHHPSS
jgi:hypothetical protein